MSSLKEIIEAWVIANNPTEKQLKLAEERSKICAECPSQKVILKKLNIGYYCSECGCPITKKIFTNRFNPCDLGKWEDVDNRLIPQKNSKSII